MVVRIPQLNRLLPPRKPFPRLDTPLDSLRQQSGGPGLQNIIDQSETALLVSSLTSEGIELSDGLLLRGPAIILNNRPFLWEVPNQKWAGWGKQTFQLFDVVVPKPEILLFGTGTVISRPPPSIRQYLSSLGIQLDIMDTRNACSTYNLLIEEGRRVAAALLPTAEMGSWRDSSR